LLSDGVAARLREGGHAGALWNVLADQAAGIFVSAALPRVIQGGEEESCAGSLLELLVVVATSPLS